MINHIHASLGRLRQGPVGPVRAVLGVVAVAVGLFVVREYVQDQMDQLAGLGGRALELQHELARSAGRVEALEDQAVAAAYPADEPYPADEDLAPLHAGRRFMADPAGGAE